MGATSSGRVAARTVGKAIFLKRLAFSGGLLAIAMGIFGLLGWCRGIEPFASIPAIFIAMSPAAAIFFILAGIGIVSGIYSQRRLILAVSMPMLGITVLNLVDILTAWTAIEGGYRHSHAGSDHFHRFDEMALSTAAMLLIGSMSLGLSASRRPILKLASQYFAVLLAVVGLYVLAIHGLNLIPEHFRGAHVPMTPAEAIGLMLIGNGLLSATNEGGITLLWRDDGPAGSIWRTVLPIVLTFPILGGVLQLWAVRHGFYSGAVGTALQGLADTFVTLAALMLLAAALYRNDQLRRQREADLKLSDQFNRLLASANPDSVALLGEDGTILFCNDALAQSYGVEDKAELIGIHHTSGLDAYQKSVAETALDEARINGTARFSLPMRHASGEIRWFDTLFSQLPIEEESPFRFLSISRDITERKRTDDQVRWRAAHDELTSLPNRANFQAQLERRIAGAGKHGFALMLIDVDDFKLINDTLGHDAGDALLSTIASRVSGAVRDDDFVARLGGDEFAVILHEVIAEADLMAAADRILENLREPWNYKGCLADWRVSIGAATAPRHGDDAEGLFKNADIALYSAKAKGKGQLAIFQDRMKARVEGRSKEITLARQALRDDLIVPYYQPKIDLASGEVKGFEALLRWRKGSGAVKLPVTINAAFEDYQLGRELTERMLSQVLLDMRRWLDDRHDFGHVAINVTASDLKLSDFAERLLERLEAHSIPRRQIQVEVTETVFLGRGAEYVEQTLLTLHDKGIRIALDDFGTGYASLSHLKQFPVDILKIDRSFMEDFEQNPHSHAIVATVMGLGRGLNIEVIAEGVETSEQARYLLSHGCRQGQGHLFGEAMPASKVPAFCGVSRRQDRKVA